jgi:beta-phosphoglucomutase
MSLRALLFDLDGTLVDSDAVHIEAFRAISAVHGVSFDDDFFVQHMSGHSNAEICRALFPDMSVSEHERIADEKEALFRSMIDGAVLAIPGVVATVDWALAKGLALGVVSNAPRENVQAVLRSLGLLGRFDVEICGGSVPRGKPDPMPYSAALDRLALAADQAVAFEDTALGIRAAVGAGIATVGLTTTQPAEALTAAGAALAIGNYEDKRLESFLAKRLIQ